MLALLRTVLTTIYRLYFSHQYRYTFYKLHFFHDVDPLLAAFMVFKWLELGHKLNYLFFQGHLNTGSFCPVFKHFSVNSSRIFCLIRSSPSHVTFYQSVIGGQVIVSQFDYLCFEASSYVAM